MNNKSIMVATTAAALSREAYIALSFTQRDTLLAQAESAINASVANSDNYNSALVYLGGTTTAWAVAAVIEVLHQRGYLVYMSTHQHALQVVW